MRFFEQKLNLGILFIALPLLFLPKMNLMTLDTTQTAGLRLDDLILLFLGLLIGWSHLYLQRPLTRFEGWIGLITLFALLSFIFNQLLVTLHILHIEANIFYVFRLLEYFLFFYIGSMTFFAFSGKKIILYFFVWNILFMLLQKLNVAGGIGWEGYLDNVSERVQGIASFPSEMGLLLNLIFCYIINNESFKLKILKRFSTPLSQTFVEQWYLFGLFSFFGTFIIFTGNRISILALLICFFFHLKQHFNWRSISSAIQWGLLLPLIMICALWVMKQNVAIYERSTDLFSFKNIDLFQSVWEKIDILNSPSTLDANPVQNYDLSWWIRIHKWLFMTKSYLYHPECYLQGLGPGYCGAALDGGLLRIVVEQGLIGAFLFGCFFKALYQINAQTKWMTIAFLINMIFFDAYLAYKSMSFFLFVCGNIYEEKTRQLENIPLARARAHAHALSSFM